MNHHHFLPGAFLFLFLHMAATAMSLRDAGANMLYFEHARLAAEHCEQRGFPVRPTYEAWVKSNSVLRIGAVGAIRLHAAEGGLSKSEQQAILREAVDNQRERAREHISRKGVDCHNFNAALQMYSTLLKR